MGYKKSVFRNLALVTQLGLCVLTPIFLGVFAGSYIDTRFGVKSTIFLLILGTLGGGRGAYMMAQRMIATEQKEKQRECLERDKKADNLPFVSKPKQASRVRTQMNKTDTLTGGEESDD